MIIQSAAVLQRPWCLLEVSVRCLALGLLYIHSGLFCSQLYAAIQADIPVIAVTVPGKGYDFQAASNLLQNLDSELDAVNPGECSRGFASCSADTDTVQLYP